MGIHGLRESLAATKRMSEMGSECWQWMEDLDEVMFTVKAEVPVTSIMIPCSES